MDNRLRLLAAVSDLLVDVLTDAASMGTFVTPSGGNCDDHWYMSPYSVEEYILFHVPEIHAHTFAIMYAGEAVTMCAGYREQEVAFAGRLERWKRWDGRQDPTAETNAPFIKNAFHPNLWWI